MEKTLSQLLMGIANVPLGGQSVRCPQGGTDEAVLRKAASDIDKYAKY